MNLFIEFIEFMNLLNLLPFSAISGFAHKNRILLFGLNIILPD